MECPTKHLPALLEAIVKILGNVSEGRWQMLCEATGRPEGEKEVSECGTTVFLKNRAPGKQ